MKGSTFKVHHLRQIIHLLNGRLHIHGCVYIYKYIQIQIQIQIQIPIDRLPTTNSFEFDIQIDNRRQNNKLVTSNIYQWCYIPGQRHQSIRSAFASQENKSKKLQILLLSNVILRRNQVIDMNISEHSYPDLFFPVQPTH